MNKKVNLVFLEYIIKAGWPVNNCCWKRNTCSNSSAWVLKISKNIHSPHMWEQLLYCLSRNYSMLYNIQCLSKGFLYSSHAVGLLYFFFYFCFGINFLCSNACVWANLTAVVTKLIKLIRRFCENMSQFILDLFIHTNVIKLVKEDPTREAG